MNLNELAAQSVAIRTAKGFKTPNDMDTAADDEASRTLALLSFYVTGITIAVEAIRDGAMTRADLVPKMRATLELAHDAAEFPGLPPGNALLAKLVLIVSEVGEAIKAVINDDRENLGEELADIIIRDLDIGGSLKFDMDAVVAKKSAVNEGRPERHGRLA